MLRIPPIRTSSRIDVPAGAGLVVLWSSGFIGAELGTRHAPPDTLLTWRYLVAAALFGAIVALRGQPVRTQNVVRHGVVGLLCQLGFLGGVYAGASLGVSPGTSALVAALQPLVVATLAHVVLGERTSVTERAGLALGIAGVALVVSGDLRTSDAPAWAYLLPFAAMLSLSAGTVLDRKWRPAGSLLDTLTIQTAAVAVVLVTGTAATGRLSPPAAPAFWWAVAWVVVLSTFGGYGFYFLVLRRSGSTRASSLLYLTPPTTMAWAAVAFGDVPGLPAAAGTAVCAIAVALVLRRRGEYSACEEGARHGPLVVGMGACRAGPDR